MVGQKADVYLNLLGEGIPVIDGTIEFILGLPHDFPVGIASAAMGAEIDFILQRIGLRNRFCAVTSAEDVTRSKPDPESFLTTLGRLTRLLPGLIPSQVLVIEDSFKGVAAARNAGMRTIALTTSYPMEMLTEADLIVEGLSGWSLEKVEQALDV